MNSSIAKILSIYGSQNLVQMILMIPVLILTYLRRQALHSVFTFSHRVDILSRKFKITVCRKTFNIVLKLTWPIKTPLCHSRPADQRHLNTVLWLNMGLITIVTRDMGTLKHLLGKRKGICSPKSKCGSH